MLHREMLVNGYFLGGECDQSTGKLLIRSPYDSHVVGTAAEAGRPEIEEAIRSAREAFETWRNSEKRARQSLLSKISASVRERREELAQLLVEEIGKPITWARGEVDRTALTFQLAADNTSSYGFEELPLNFDPRGTEYHCEVQRFPIGIILCIVPYNWPLNLAAHKIAPALATGNTAIVKPSSIAPLSTLTLIRIIHDCGCPPGVVNGVPCNPNLAERMALDPRIGMLSFTGSPTVGWHLKALMPHKKVSLELGGDATAIVTETADVDWAIKRIIAGKYGYAGQICISIQHVLVQESIYSEVCSRLVSAAKECPSGDPRLETTVCGPLISCEAAVRVEEWIHEAISQGCKLLVGGQRQGNVILPSIVELSTVASSATRIATEEVFGPVMTLSSYATLDEAIQRVNSSKYGIQTGVFTQRAAEADQAFRELEVGGVVINDYPTLRFDNMPYGGIKRSGFGREGVRYAMDEMTELKVKLSRLV